MFVIPLELLAPAGGPEQLEYALRFGADAIYMATQRFGMRRRASNFCDADLAEAVRHTHQFGKKLYLACNTLIHTDELAELPAYFEHARACGVDALILSDLGALSPAHTYAPDIAIHVSTQASVLNAAAALVWYELGARRIVCAREMSLDDIARMHAELPEDLELEVFAHGSMCMAYSGRCLISDFLNGRSANAGYCTQPCRWEWQLREPTRPDRTFTAEEDEHATYLFSSCDLNMSEHLGELADAGVDCIKLEGRGRGTYYTAVVTAAYRRAIDELLEEDDASDVRASIAHELETVSHHSYSTGFFFGPAHQAPYEAKTCSDWIWVAEVLSCERSKDAPTDVGVAYESVVRARNHFDAQDILEVISPGQRSRRVRIRELHLISHDQDGVEHLEPVLAVTRQMECYRMLSDCELHPYDLIRARKKTDL